jgi:hypothetical protein
MLMTRKTLKNLSISINSLRNVPWNILMNCKLLKSLIVQCSPYGVCEWNIRSHHSFVAGRNLKWAN